MLQVKMIKSEQTSDKVAQQFSYALCQFFQYFQTQQV